jgi:hypothetical protein
MKHLLSAADLSRDDAVLVLDTAAELAALPYGDGGRTPVTGSGPGADDGALAPPRQESADAPMYLLRAREPSALPPSMWPAAWRSRPARKTPQKSAHSSKPLARLFDPNSLLALDPFAD